MPYDPYQLACNRERLAELEARWSPSILNLTQDDAVQRYRTGKEIYELQRRTDAAEKEKCQARIERKELPIPMSKRARLAPTSWR